MTNNFLGRGVLAALLVIGGGLLQETDAQTTVDKEPVIEVPAIEVPVAEEPVIEKPAIEENAVENIVEEPAAEKPVAEPTEEPGELELQAEMLAKGDSEPLQEDPNNLGQANFDRALEIKFTAEGLKDLNEAVELLNSALDQGLDADNTDFAEQVLTATMLQRAMLYSGAVLGKKISDPRVDPRWIQLRQNALMDLVRVVSYDDQQTEAWMLMGRLLSLPLGNQSEARLAFSKVIRAAELASEDPNEETVDPKMLAQAYALRGVAQKEAAARLNDFDHAITLQPESAEYLLLRARLHQADGRPEKCLADIERAIEIAPDNAKVHELKALALLTQKKPDEALGSFNRWTELAPQAIEPYQYRGEVYNKLGQLDKAVEQLDKALEMAPNNPASLLIRAELLMLSEEFERALADVESVLRQQPGLVRAHLMRARALDRVGRASEAVDALERLAQAAPDRADVQLQLAAYYVEKKMPQKAVAVLTRVLELAPDNELARRWRGDMYLLIGEHAAAVADFLVSIENNPLDVGALNNYAWTLSTSPHDAVRNGPTAVEMALKACEITEYAEPHILSTLAASYAEAGDFEKAVRWSKEAIAKANEQEKSNAYDGQLEAELASYQSEQPWRELQQMNGDSNEEATTEEESAGPKADDSGDTLPPTEETTEEADDLPATRSFDF